MIESFEKNPAKGGMPMSASDPIRKAIFVTGSSRPTPASLRMSCSPARAWMTTPAARKRSALKNACVIRWNIAFPYAPRPAPRNM